MVQVAFGAPHRVNEEPAAGGVVDRGRVLTYIVTPQRQSVETAQRPGDEDSRERRGQSPYEPPGPGGIFR